MTTSEFNRTSENFFKKIILLIIFSPFFLSWLSLLTLRFFDIGGAVSFNFYIYIGVLCILFLATINYYRIAICVWFILAAEFTFGMTPYIIKTVGLPKLYSVFVPLKQSEGPYVFHPVLGAIPKPDYVRLNYKGDSPENRVSHSTNSVRVNELPFRNSLRHIAVFGGSTTYDVRKIDKDTWVSKLDKSFDNYTISNNGVPGYSSSEHVIQTIFYVDRAGNRPQCAVYHLGPNDIRNLGIKNLDSAYANFHRLSQYGNLKIRKKSQTPSPILNLAFSYFTKKDLPFPEIRRSTESYEKRKYVLFSIVKKNIETIVAQNKAREIKTMLLGHVFNLDELNRTDAPLKWMPFLSRDSIWPLQKEFNLFLQDVASELDVSVFIPDIKLFNVSDFVPKDYSHFSPSGAEKFAKILRPEMEKFCN